MLPLFPLDADIPSSCSWDRLSVAPLPPSGWCVRVLKAMRAFQNQTNGLLRPVLLPACDSTSAPPGPESAVTNNGPVSWPGSRSVSHPIGTYLFSIVCFYNH